MSTVKDATAVARTAAEVATAALSILNQIYQFLTITENRLSRAETDEERYNIREDIKQLKNLQTKVKTDPNYQFTNEENLFFSRFSQLEINSELHDIADEYLKNAYDTGVIKGYSIEKIKGTDMSIIYSYTRDNAYISKMMTEVQNAFKNQDVITKSELIDQRDLYNKSEKDKQARNPGYKAKEAQVVAFVGLDKKGITKADIEMLKSNNLDFKYHIGKDTNGKDAIFILDKDINRLESRMIENRLLTSLSTEAILLNKAMNTDILDENLNTKNGKSVYMCCPDKDLVIMIDDDSFEVMQNGRSIDFKLPGQQVNLIDGEEHYVNLKTGNRDLINEYISNARHPIILEEHEFKKDFTERQAFIRQKMESEIRLEREITPEISHELDRLFDPSINYELNNKTKDEKELIQVIAGRKKEKMIDGITYAEWYRRMEIKHDKLNFDRANKDTSMSGRSLDVLDFTKEVMAARIDNQLDNEYKEQILKDYTNLDLDDKEDILKIITGLTPDELGAISSYMETYVKESQLEDHATFVEVTDPSVAEYWHDGRDDKNFDRMHEDIDNANKEIEDATKEKTFEYDRDGNYIDDLDADDLDI